MIYWRDSGIQLVEDGALDAFGNFCAQQLVMAGVPREDLISARLDGPSGDQSIVDGPAGNPVGGGFPNTGDSRRPRDSQSGTGYGYFPETR